MEIEPTHRLKTFGLAVVLLLSAISAGGTWLDGSVPLDRAGSPADTLSATADVSVFVQSGGLVPDGVDDTSAGETDVRQAAVRGPHDVAVR